MSIEGSVGTGTGDPQSGTAHMPANAVVHVSRHGSSKMLATYLGDIEYLMREQLWAEAAPLALALPHICVALADASLVSSCERYMQWCESWVAQCESEEAQRARAGLFSAWCDRSGCSELDASAGVPVE